MSWVVWPRLKPLECCSIPAKNAVEKMPQGYALPIDRVVWIDIFIKFFSTEAAAEPTHNSLRSSSVAPVEEIGFDTKDGVETSSLSRAVDRNSEFTMNNTGKTFPKLSCNTPPARTSTGSGGAGGRRAQAEEGKAARSGDTEPGGVGGSGGAEAREGMGHRRVGARADSQ